MAASASGNVVNLNERRPLSAVESRRVLNDCRELAMKRLSRSLREMLVDIEEELFQMAESSYDREMQKLYLEARGKAKEKWPKMEAAFSRHFIDVFNHKMRGELGTAMKTIAASTQELRLVEEDDLAESIAMQELAARLREQNESELSLLGERVAVLLGKNDLKDEENPISPQAVCDALKFACGEIESSVKLKLVLLKQIEQHVAKALHGVYADLNSELIRWNVLPDLKVGYRKAVNLGGNATTPDKPENSSMLKASAGPGGNELLAALQCLLQAQPFGQTAGTESPLSAVPASAPPADHRQSVFIDSLTEKQHLESLMDVKNRVEGLPDLGQALGVVNVLHQIKANAENQGIGQLDAITIDIVAMLFDFIFDDEKVPNQIKALVGRLQIPVLKVAMLDKSFFSSRTHPARRLLDSISQASIAWGQSVDQDDPLYQEIAFIAERIQSEFDRDVQIFTDALNLLNAFIEERDASAESIADRTAELMQKRETEEIAWVVAGDAVGRRLTSAVPANVRAFLQEHWQSVLKELYIRHGEEHHAYLSAASMMDDLIWSIAPKNGSDERKQLVNTLPALLRALHAGLDVIGLPQAQRGRFFDELVALHSAAVKAGLSGIVASGIESTVQSAPAPANAAEAQYVINPEGELFITRITENEVQIDEVALVGASPSFVENGDLYLERVSALRRGDWVEFRQAEGQSTRARLSWISPQRGIYLFTNPRSPRATSVSPEALAYQLKSGLAEIVADEPIFDRAVNGVLGSLSLN